MTLYVANVPGAEYHLKAHLFSDCPGLRCSAFNTKRTLKSAVRKAQELAPGIFSELLRDLCKRCQKRAATSGQLSAVSKQS